MGESTVNLPQVVGYLTKVDILYLGKLSTVFYYPCGPSLQAFIVEGT